MQLPANHIYVLAPVAFPDTVPHPTPQARPLIIREPRPSLLMSTRDDYDSSEDSSLTDHSAFRAADNHHKEGGVNYDVGNDGSDPVVDDEFLNFSAPSVSMHIISAHGRLSSFPIQQPRRRPDPSKTADRGGRADPVARVLEERPHPQSQINVQPAQVYSPPPISHPNISKKNGGGSDLASVLARRCESAEGIARRRVSHREFRPLLRVRGGPNGDLGKLAARWKRSIDLKGKVRKQRQKFSSGRIPPVINTRDRATPGSPEMDGAIPFALPVYAAGRLPEKFEVRYDTKRRHPFPNASMVPSPTLLNSFEEPAEAALGAISLSSGAEEVACLPTQDAKPLGSKGLHGISQPHGGGPDSYVNNPDALIGEEIRNPNLLVTQDSPCFPFTGIHGMPPAGNKDEAEEVYFQADDTPFPAKGAKELKRNGCTSTNSYLTVFASLSDENEKENTPPANEVSGFNSQKRRSKSGAEAGAVDSGDSTIKNVWADRSAMENGDGEDENEDEYEDENISSIASTTTTSSSFSFTEPLPMDWDDVVTHAEEEVTGPFQGGGATNMDGAGGAHGDPVAGPPHVEGVVAPGADDLLVAGGSRTEPAPHTNEVTATTPVSLIPTLSENIGISSGAHVPACIAGELISTKNDGNHILPREEGRGVKKPVDVAVLIRRRIERARRESTATPLLTRPPEGCGATFTPEFLDVRKRLRRVEPGPGPLEKAKANAGSGVQLAPLSRNRHHPLPPGGDDSEAKSFATPSVVDDSRNRNNVSEGTVIETKSGHNLTLTLAPPLLPPTTCIPVKTETPITDGVLPYRISPYQGERMADTKICVNARSSNTLSCSYDGGSDNNSVIIVPKDLSSMDEMTPTLFKPQPNIVTGSVEQGLIRALTQKEVKEGSNERTAKELLKYPVQEISCTHANELDKEAAEEREATKEYDGGRCAGEGIRKRTSHPPTAVEQVRSGEVMPARPHPVRDGKVKERGSSSHVRQDPDEPWGELKLRGTPPQDN